MIVKTLRMCFWCVLKDTSLQWCICRVSWGRGGGHQGSQDPGVSAKLHCSSWLRELVFTYESAFSNRIPWIAVGEEQRTWGYLKGHLPWLTVVHHLLLSAWRQIPFVTDCSHLPCSESAHFVTCSLSKNHLPFWNPLSLSMPSQLGYPYSWQTLTLHGTEIPASGKSANVDTGTWNRL